MLKENLLGSPDIDVDRDFGGVMQTFDNTRPLVAAMACGVTRAALEETRRILGDRDRDRLRPTRNLAVRVGRGISRDGGRLRVVVPADAARGMDG